MILERLARNKITLLPVMKTNLNVAPSSECIMNYMYTNYHRPLITSTISILLIILYEAFAIILTTCQQTKASK